jgi:hypothetical protein
MTEQNIDELYEMTVNAMKDLKPEAAQDFASVGSPRFTVQINIQALSKVTFSVRITNGIGKPFYAQGSQAEILFSLRHFIRNVIESDSIDEKEDHKAPLLGTTATPNKEPLSKDDLDVFFGDGINFLPRGRP